MQLLAIVGKVHGVLQSILLNSSHRWSQVYDLAVA